MMTRQVTLLLVAALSVVNGRDFLSPRTGINSEYLNSMIHEALNLNVLLGSGHAIDDSRLKSINATLAPLFNALPKNEHGRLSVPFFRYAIRRFFRQHHGWIIKGFESQEEDDKSQVSDAKGGHVMKEKIPEYVVATMQKKLSHKGVALEDMIIAVASIERLIFDEVVYGVETAYSLNKLDATGLINIAPNLTHTMASYFLVAHLNGNSTNMTQHWMEKRAIKSFYPHWLDTLNFIKDNILVDRWLQRQSRNPFLQSVPLFSFEDTVRVARTFSELFGPYSNHECHVMKVKLAELDVYGTGRVKLADFYRGDWQFRETTEYLSAMGALDNSSEQLGPQVIIPNYVTGPNNCISSSVYYDVCCLNECDGIYKHLESRLTSHTASAAEVVQAIEEGIAESPLLSSTAPVEPRNLSAPLRDMLQQVARHHQDMIPLHGRLFAQWLHYAFPQECPYPHLSGVVGPHTSPAEIRRSMGKVSVTDEELKQFIEEDRGSAPSPEAGLDMWVMQEELVGEYDSPLGKKSLLRTFAPALGLLSVAAIVLKEIVRLVQGRTLWQIPAAGKVIEYNV